MAPSQDAVKMDQWLHPYSVLIDMNNRKWLDSNGSNLMVAEKIVLYYHKTKSDMQENPLSSWVLLLHAQLSLSVSLSQLTLKPC